MLGLEWQLLAFSGWYFHLKMEGRFPLRYNFFMGLTREIMRGIQGLL